MYVKFWAKTALYRWTPGGFGRYRRLRRLKSPDYQHARDRHPVRERHNSEKGWGDEWSGGVRTRTYQSYDEYLTHQRQKLEEIIKARGELLDNRIVSSQRVKFFRRFHDLPQLVAPTARILCLGARLGTEVEVLRDMGYDNAVGIDLNPGPDNPLVEPGDFQHLDAADGSVDVVYSNCVDHSFDLDAFFAEHARVLKPDGYALYDILVHNDDGAAPFESVIWSDHAAVVAQMEAHFGDVVQEAHDGSSGWLSLRARPAA